MIGPKSWRVIPLYFSLFHFIFVFLHLALLLLLLTAAVVAAAAATATVICYNSSIKLGKRTSLMTCTMDSSPQVASKSGIPILGRILFLRLPPPWMT